MMSADCYRQLCKQRPELTPYEELPLWDSHDQNIVDVD